MRRSYVGLGLWVALLAGLPLVAWADVDGDGIPDASDNCTVDFNPEQIDADCDGFGNACDTDFDNDGATGFNDINMALAAGSFDPLIDVQRNTSSGSVRGSDGVVDAADLDRITTDALVITVPGPSAGPTGPPGTSTLPPSCGPDPGPRHGNYFCIENTGKGTGYAWKLTFPDAPGEYTENFVPPHPAGAPPFTLMLQIASSINAVSALTGIKVDWISGTPRPASFPPAGGAYAPIAVEPACFWVTPVPVTLSVGADLPPTCLVGNGRTNGCIFNPLIYHAAPALPALWLGGSAALVAVLGVGSFVVLRRRSMR